MDKKTVGRFFLFASIAWAVLILVLTLTPGKYVPSYSLFSYDKLGHAGIFCIQSVLLMFTLRHQYNRKIQNSILASMAVTIIYGFIIEAIQGLIPDRSMDIYDAIANIAGSFLAPLVFYLVNKVIHINNI
ncbi:VanZ family protein [Fulvivirga sedimenti]|uniref:VanZ family protein n=1 Tax=Fulvivirga sedimenti TaxID=2879465 RepID=A0A9X1L0S1_9BACT|nr:VanZ family protein [Fulvivirga sedimenti]